MLRLIKADLASTWKPYLRNRPPSFFVNCRALNALLRERSQFRLQIATHQIELVAAILIGRVECGLCRWQREDQPAATRIHGGKPKHVAKKCTISLGVFTVNNDVSARNHLPS